MNEKIVSALIGLSGASGNNGKTENTDSIVLNALLHCFEASDEDAIVNEIKKEKFTISPNCATCPTPCGNTSDYDMTKYHKNEELKAIKEDLIRETVNLAKKIEASGKTYFPEEIYQALSYFSYELTIPSYQKLIDTLKQL